MFAAQTAKIIRPQNCELLWRPRRGTAIRPVQDSGETSATISASRQAHLKRQQIIDSMYLDTAATEDDMRPPWRSIRDALEAESQEPVTSAVPMGYALSAVLQKWTFRTRANMSANRLHGLLFQIVGALAAP